VRVKLLAFTPCPDSLVGEAAATCYSPGTAGDDCGFTIGAEAAAGADEARAARRIERCIRHGHLSVLEHASFTFLLEEISRVTSHQLVRHRLASYSQQSQRYVVLDEATSPVLPPALARRPELADRYRSGWNAAVSLYRLCLEQGLEGDDARYCLPQGVPTRLVVTMNARELRHFFHLRCCMHAQWEIRAMAWLMLKAVREVAPRIFADAGPGCLEGQCPEGDHACFEHMARRGFIPGDDGPET